MALITQAEYARHRGCSQAAVNYAVKAGRITLVDGKVDAAKADKQWAKNSRARPRSDVPSHPTPAVKVTRPAPAPVAPPAPPPAVEPIDTGDVPNYQESRARREAAEAEMAELKVRKERGLLVEAATVRAEFSRQLAAVREGLLNIPARLAPVVAAESTVSRVQTLIDGELRAVLAQLVEGA